MGIHYVEDYEAVTGKKRVRSAETKVIKAKEVSPVSGSDVEPETKSTDTAEE